MIERDSLRKSLQETMDKITAKDREYKLLVENLSVLEKQIQQLQSSEEKASHIKSALDYELAKIKVSSPLFSFLNVFVKVLILLI